MLTIGEIVLATLQKFFRAGFVLFRGRSTNHTNNHERETVIFLIPNALALALRIGTDHADAEDGRNFVVARGLETHCHLRLVLQEV